MLDNEADGSRDSPYSGKKQCFRGPGGIHCGDNVEEEPDTEEEVALLFPIIGNPPTPLGKSNWLSSSSVHHKSAIIPSPVGPILIEGH